MLVYAVKKYLPSRCGIMTLETPDHGYIYVDYKILESSVLLSSQAFYQTFESAESIVKPLDKSHRESIKRFYDFLPYPLKPLALLLYWTEQEYDILSDQIGCLHIISSIINPYHWLKAPKDQRMQLGPFGPSIRTEYSYEWKSFIESCIDYETLTNPTDSSEKFPIFVINAVSGNLPLSGGVPFTASAPSLSGGYEIEIDFDKVLSDTASDEVIATPKTSETTDNAGINVNYKKLLE